MWKVRLKEGYNELCFYFEKFGGATNFIHEALRNNKNLTVTLTVKNENKAVEEGEE